MLTCEEMVETVVFKGMICKCMFCEKSLTNKFENEKHFDFVHSIQVFDHAVISVVYVINF